MHPTAKKALKFVCKFEEKNKRIPTEQKNGTGVDVKSINSNKKEERHIEVKGIGNNSFTLFSSFNYNELLKSKNKFYLYIVKIYPNNKTELYILTYREIKKLIPKANKEVFEFARNKDIKHISINFSIHIQNIAKFKI
jgi:Domain of unknown function (DUF3883)